MSENTTILQPERATNLEPIVPEEKLLTAREIFDKITELQKLITETSPHPHEVFIMREKTYCEMLALYKKMYDDLSTIEIAQNPAMQKQHIIDEMLQIIKDKTSSGIATEYAKKILITCMSDK